MLLEVALRRQGEAVHHNVLAVPGPGVAGPVPVELDAVAFGVIEVEGLADEVVGAAGEGLRLELRCAGDGGGQRGLVLEQQGGVEEAGLAAGGQVQPGRRGQVDQRLLPAAEVEPAVLLGHDVEAEGALVVVGHELHVADLEHHGAHGEFGGKEILGAGFWGHFIAPVLRRPPSVDDPS